MSKTQLEKDYGEVKARVNLPVSFDLATAIPIDNRSLMSKVEAENAAVKAKPAGDTSTSYYYGMTLSVLERMRKPNKTGDGYADTEEDPQGQSVVSVYAITADNTLQKINTDTSFNNSVLSRLNALESKSADIDVNNTTEKHSGLKITEDQNKVKKIEIDDEVIFIFNSGSASENVDRVQK